MIILKEGRCVKVFKYLRGYPYLIGYPLVIITVPTVPGLASLAKLHHAR